jgi:hypothetical protein
VMSLSNIGIPLVFSEKFFFPLPGSLSAQEVCHRVDRTKIHVLPAERCRLLYFDHQSFYDGGVLMPNFNLSISYAPLGTIMLLSIEDSNPFPRFPAHAISSPFPLQNMIQDMF